MTEGVELSQPTVLLVDDEEDLLDVMQTYVERAGMKVILAHDGLEGLDVFKTQSLHAIVSDLRMPRLDGIAFLKEVRNQPGLDYVPFIFVTGFSDLSVEDALELGAEVLLEKPVDYNHLVDVLKRVIVFDEQKKKKRKLHLKVSIAPDASKIDRAKLDVTEKGMFVAMREHFPTPTETIHFKFTFSEAQIPPIEGKGIVRWVRTAPSPDKPAGIGVEFTSIPRGPRARILQMLCHHGTTFEEI